MRSGHRARPEVAHPHLHLLPFHFGQGRLQQIRTPDRWRLGTDNCPYRGHSGQYHESLALYGGALLPPALCCAIAVSTLAQNRREVHARLSAFGPISAAGQFVLTFQCWRPSELARKFGRRKPMSLRGQIGQHGRAGPSDSDASMRQRPLPGDLKKAIGYIRDHPNGKMSIADLVAHCGVSERTLRKHFQTFMAVSPLKCWRQLRLAAARSFLLEDSNKTSITEAATRFGFRASRERGVCG